jgi:two pore calcium channel protein 1
MGAIPIQTTTASEFLPSPNTDGGSHSIHNSQVPSLVSGADSPPSSPTGHNWEMNYQEAAIYLQVSGSGSVSGGRPWRLE